MQDKLDELHYIYKMIGNYGFCTVQELLDKYNKQKEVIDKVINILEENDTEYTTIDVEELIYMLKEVNK